MREGEVSNLGIEGYAVTLACEVGIDGFHAASSPGIVFVKPCLYVGTTIPPVEPGIRCILRSTKGEAIESVFPVRRPATITVVLAPISCVNLCGVLKYIFFFGCSIFRE